MWYNKKKIEIIDPKEWYNLIYKQYQKFHSKLDKWDNFTWKRFLPRDLKNKSIVDLGAWDCRMFKFFKDMGIKEYVACDISENMLKKCPSSVKKIVCDLNYFNCNLPENYFDLAVAFFVLIYIENLDIFFENLYNILKNWGRVILFHHIERRPYIYKVNWKSFKIKNFTWSFDQIRINASKYFFDMFVKFVGSNENEGMIIVLDK